VSDKTIWAVSSGDYSDYGVTAVFASKESAEAYAAIENQDDDPTAYGDARVEEFTYFEVLPPHVVVLLVSQRVGGAPYPHDYLIRPEPYEHKSVVWGNAAAAQPACNATQSRRDHPTVGRGCGHTIDVRVVGTDHERVRKVFSEQVAQAKADARVTQATVDFPPGRHT
jgi:hypothetical protein